MGWSYWRQSQGWTVSKLWGGYFSSNFILSFLFLYHIFINLSYLLLSYLQMTTTTMTMKRREADPKKLQRMTMLRSQLSKLTKSSQLLIVFWNRMTRWASSWCHQPNPFIYPNTIPIIPIVDSILKQDEQGELQSSSYLITLLNCEIESKLSCVKTCLMNFIFRTKMVISTGLSSYQDKSSDRSWQNVSSGSKYLKSFSADFSNKEQGSFWC